jgi:hypothetical protein
VIGYVLGFAVVFVLGKGGVLPSDFGSKVA